jgi:YegS/Rv2252/BmrU family lipid kinase
MERLVVIHNPGGGSATDEDLALIVATLGAQFAVEVELVEAGDASRSPASLARAAVEKGAKLLVASGGDGTVSGVASAAIGRADVAVGIIARGTGNSIAGALGIPVGLVEACAVIASGAVVVVDTALVNGQPMVLMASVGLHADAITGTSHEAKQQLGVLAYVATGLGILLEESPFEATLTVGESHLRCDASAITIANLAPARTVLAQGPADVNPTDGLLDVTVVALEGLPEALATAAHLYRNAVAGLPADRENVAFMRVDRIVVETKEPLSVMLDGEAVGTTPIEVICCPASLRVLVPAGS